jgi:protein-S-isoprenylcysteine O-methyltransferase Ste14
MTSSVLVLRVLWGGLILYWIAKSWGNKPETYRLNPIWRLLALAFAIGVWALVRQYATYFNEPVFSDDAVCGPVGVGLTLAGFAVAVWARRTLGSNWSANPTIKVDHELVRRGPYRFVRHPIYTGLILAFVGTALVDGRRRAGVWVAVGILMLWIKSRFEEALMRRRFPEAYPAYARATKALIPYVL